MAIPIASYGIYKGLTSNAAKNTIAGLVTKKSLSPSNFNIAQARKMYNIDNLKAMLPQMDQTTMDKLYRQAYINADYETGQTIRDYHFMKNAPNTQLRLGDTPQVTYHGSPYGGHTVFNSSKSNNTIGGASAIGNKGNFSTLNLDAAKNYAGTYEPNNSISQYDKLLNIKTLHDYGNTHPYEHNTDRMVYPLYVNAETPNTYDFKGSGWGHYPNPEQLSGREYTLSLRESQPYLKRDNKWDEKYFNLSTLKNRLNQLKEQGFSTGTKLIDTQYDNMYQPKKVPTGKRIIREGQYNPETKQWEYYNNIKGITELSSSPYKPTTNGIVKKEFDNNANSIFINNVVDANTSSTGIKNYPIDEVVFRNSNQAKLANPFTVDDNNNLIPISKRDNFLNPDIRYGWIGPTVGTGLYLQNVIHKNRRGGRIEWQERYEKENNKIRYKNNNNGQ